MPNQVRQYRTEEKMIQSVERAALILKALTTDSGHLGVTELAERLGLAKGTVHGLIRTLEAHELVEQDSETGKYRLGVTALQLGNAFLENNELRGRALLWADSLASRAQEAVRVGVLNGDNMLIVHHVFRPDNSVQILEVGASIPWHACALGKAMVAHLDARHRRQLLARPLLRLTGRTVISSAALERELTRIERAGFATDNQEAMVGEAGIAAPVFDHRGVVGAIGITGPVERLIDNGPDPATTVIVRDTARSLTRDLGGARLAFREAGA
jgi:DNA-binding IclR family transcriptional regulator